MPGSAAEAAIVALIIQAALTGIQSITFLLCLRWHIFSDDGATRRKNIWWFMLVISILIFLLSVATLGFGLQSVLLTLKGGNRLPPTSITAAANVAQTSVMMAINGVLIFRCWAVYDKWWPAAIIPVVLWLYNFSSIIVVLYWTASGNAKLQVIPFTLIYPDQRIVHMHEGFAFASLVISIYTTSGIIIHCYHRTSLRHHSPIHFAARLIAESGFIFTFASIFQLCALLIYDSPSGSQYPLLIISDMIIPISGITHDIIIIRVAVRRSHEAERTTPNSTVVENSIHTSGSFPSLEPHMIL